MYVVYWSVHADISCARSAGPAIKFFAFWCFVAPAFVDGQCGEICDHRNRKLDYDVDSGVNEFAT